MPVEGKSERLTCIDGCQWNWEGNINFAVIDANESESKRLTCSNSCR